MLRADSGMRELSVEEQETVAIALALATIVANGGVSFGPPARERRALTTPVLSGAFHLLGQSKCAPATSAGFLLDLVLFCINETERMEVLNNLIRLVRTSSFSPVTQAQAPSSRYGRDGRASVNKLEDHISKKVFWRCYDDQQDIAPLLALVDDTLTRLETAPTGWEEMDEGKDECKDREDTWMANSTEGSAYDRIESEKDEHIIWAQVLAAGFIKGLGLMLSFNDGNPPLHDVSSYNRAGLVCEALAKLVAALLARTRVCKRLERLRAQQYWLAERVAPILVANSSRRPLISAFLQDLTSSVMQLGIN